MKQHSTYRIGNNSQAKFHSEATTLVIILLATLSFLSQPALAGPDPHTTSNGVAYFEGNQSNGIAWGSPPETPAIVIRNLSSTIAPPVDTVGIGFQDNSGDNVFIHAGETGRNIEIQTSKASGIFAESVGSATSTASDPFLGVPDLNSAEAAGGKVIVDSYSQITTSGSMAHGIHAQSRTTGYGEDVGGQLENFTDEGFSFQVTSVSNGILGQPVTAYLLDTLGSSVLDTNGNRIVAGTFAVAENGTFDFVLNSNLNVEAGSSYFASVDFIISGTNTPDHVIKDGINGQLHAAVTNAGSGTEILGYESFFGDYGESSMPDTEGMVFPSLQHYVDGLLTQSKQAGGGGGIVNVAHHEGTIAVNGPSSHGIIAESFGNSGSSGRNGGGFFSFGTRKPTGGANGHGGGGVSVVLNGSISNSYQGGVSDAGLGIFAYSQGGNGGRGGNGGTYYNGRRGGTGSTGGLVEVNGNGTIYTLGDYSSGILALSEGGDGGNGGDGGFVTDGKHGGYGGQGGTVVVDGAWNIETQGDKAHGIWAKSVGGNAGDGGSGGWLAGSPAGGGQASDGGNVYVASKGGIETFGEDAYGIYAQSVGGFGGSGGSGGSIFYSAGGDGSSAGSGGNVWILQKANGYITTRGDRAHALFAQSIGGGGGSGGGGRGLVSVGGKGGAGGRGGAIDVVNHGTLMTFGENARGIYAQSVGGGGGDGGDSGGLVSIGGKGSGTSDGGSVSVTNTGAITTAGVRSSAIFAESIGGGGGDGGSSGGWFSIGGSGGGGGNASSVAVVNSGQLITSNTDSSAIFAQSVGGGGGNGGGTISAGAFGALAIGGGGAVGGSGNTVFVDSDGNDIWTGGDRSHGIFAQSVGGGGGNGGYAIAASVGAWFSAAIGSGGAGAGGGSGGVVEIDNSSWIETGGNDASGIFAQSVGGGGGNGGFSVAGAVSAGEGVSFASSLSLGGAAGDGGSGSAVAVTNRGDITTSGERSYGILAQSIGGGGGNGGFSVAGSISVSDGTSVAANLSVGGSGGEGGSSGDVVLENTGQLYTTGKDAHAIFAQSVGGGGGSGGFSAAGGIASGSISASFGGSGNKGGTAGNVAVDSLGTNITTKGEHAYGILAQSIGGGGGDGGFSVAGGLSTGASVGFSMGGKGGSGGIAGNVGVSNSSTIATVGTNSHAIFAQSVGGGGGSGGFSVAGGASGGASLSASIGGTGGTGGQAGNVAADSSAEWISTGGDRSYGILAQSIGGSGGDGGFSVAGGISKSASVNFSMGGAGGTGGAAGTVVLKNSSRIATTGTDSHAIFSQSVGGGGGSGGFSVSGGISASGAAIGASIGGPGGSGGTSSGVKVESTGETISTIGERSYGILAQSIGGSGGDGGFSVAGGISKSASINFSMGGAGGDGGKSGGVSVSNTSSMATAGANSHAIFAQSIGGGGGAGGFSIAGSASTTSNSIAVSASIGGSGGAGAQAGDIKIESAGEEIFTGGYRSYGILAQSIGGTGGVGGFSVAGSLSASPSVNFSMGGAGGDGGVAGEVDVGNMSSIITTGANAHAIFAQSVGGGGGSGGFSVAAGLSTGGALSASIGGSGGEGSRAGNVVVSSDGEWIATTGERSYGILAQSIGGTGGDGGFSISGSVSKSVAASLSIGGSGGGGGVGGNVSVSNASSIATTGTNSHAIFAQSVGGSGGSGGFSVAGSLTISSNKPAVSLSFGGAGGTGSVANAVVVISSGDRISTSGDRSYGILAQSVGGGGGDGGFSVAGGISKSTSVNFSMGGEGGVGSEGGGVFVDNASAIRTTGTSSHAIMVQSVGGGGGSGGFSAAGSLDTGENAKALSVSLGGIGGAGGHAGDVAVANNGTIETQGSRAYGILAQSVGGGGGDGGDSKIIHKTVSFPGKEETTETGDTNSASKGWSLNLVIGAGGSGGEAGNGGLISVTNNSEVLTTGDASIGIFAQSVGGGGGAGGASMIDGAGGDGSENTSINLTFGLGGTGGGGGDADQVAVHTLGIIETQGDAAHGIMAQSVGGGGGAGGASILNKAPSGSGSKTSIDLAGSIGGSGGNGGKSGDVVVSNDGTIHTFGEGGYGILAQSVGGGGGHGGSSEIKTEKQEKEKDEQEPAVAITAAETNESSAGWSLGLEFGVGGSGGAGGDGGVVSVTNNGSIYTAGNSSIGIFAQSVGGGGGAGGANLIDGVGNGGSTNAQINLTFGLGGTGGAGGTSDFVNVVSSGTIATKGNNSHGILVQSVGGGGGTGGASILNKAPVGSDSEISINLDSTIGGAGGTAGDGGNVAVSNDGSIHTSGQGSYGILAQSVGGGGGHGGSSEIKIEEESKERSKEEGESSNGWTLSLGIGAAGNGGEAGHGGSVAVVNNGQITTLGDNGIAIFAQSVGGGGGAGGISIMDGAGGGSNTVDFGLSMGGSATAGASGGSIAVGSTGSIVTLGEHSHAVYAQSVGGGGGLGGSSLATGDDSESESAWSLNMSASLGSFGGAGGSGSAVLVNNEGSIETFGIDSYGLFAQSVGGGGGKSGTAQSLGRNATLVFNISLGGTAGISGDGSLVSVTNSGNVATHGQDSHGLFAQSIGAGGGIANGGSTGEGERISLGAEYESYGNGGDVSVVQAGRVDTLGNAAYAVFAQSVGGGGGAGGSLLKGISSFELNGAVGEGTGTGNGGNVAVKTTGDITTSGNGSIGIFAQSVGGGGGVAGGESGFAGSTGGAGSAGMVTIEHRGNILTTGTNALGIFAQSSTGAGRSGDVEVSLSGNVLALGEDSIAIYAQSSGGEEQGNVTVNIYSGNVVGGSGSGAGVQFAGGNDNELNNFGSIGTMDGVQGIAIMGTPQNEMVFNDGIISGSIDLGTGVNRLENYSSGILNSGEKINLGSGNRLTSAGVLSPGGEGTCLATSLNGDFRQTAAGSFVVDVSPELGSDTLLVHGAATLDGTIVVIKNAGLYRDGMTFEVLMASNGLANSFGSTNLPGAKPLVSFDFEQASDRILIKTDVHDFETLAQNRMQNAVALHLDGISKTASGDLLEILGTLQDLEKSEVEDAYAGLGPSSHEATTRAVLAASQKSSSTIRGRMDTLSSLQGSNLQPTGAAGPQSPMIGTEQLTAKNPNGLWISGAGQRGKQNGQDGFSGYTYYTSGLELGIERVFQKAIMGGASIDYASAHIDIDKGDSDIQAIGGSLYAARYSGGLYFDGIFSYAHLDFDNTRQVLVTDRKAQSSHDGELISASTSVRYDISKGAWKIGPVAAIQYLWLEEDGFKETGAGAANLSVSGRSTDSLVSELGIRITRAFETKHGLLVPAFQLGWLYDFDIGDRTITSAFEGAPDTPFSVEGQAVEQNGALLGIDVRLLGNGGLGLSLEYDAEFRQNYSVHGIRGVVHYAF